ncbi:hypothetical protein Tco_0257914 [Tanacetum coccineum]
MERTVKQLRTARLVGDAPATEGDEDIHDAVDLEGLSRMASDAVPSADMEEREEEEVPLRRKRSVYRRARTEFNTLAFAQFHAPFSTDVLPQAAISESAGPSVGADKGKAPMPDHIPIDVLFESTSGGINEFFLDSDEDEQIGMSRVVADPDSDDEVLVEILFRGQYISGAGVVVVDKLPDDEIVD